MMATRGPVGTGESALSTNPSSKALRSAYGGAAALNRRALVGTLAGALLTSAPHTARAVGASELGGAVKVSVVRGAQLADRLDERWERFSDGLRDTKTCDPATGRLRYDNGFRRDGSRVGDPVLGPLCKPPPLRPLDSALTRTVLGCAERAATEVFGASRAALEAKAAAAGAFSRARDRSAFLDELAVVPRFDLAAGAAAGEEARARAVLQDEWYGDLMAVGAFAGPPGGASQFEEAWGRLLLAALAQGAGAGDFRSPFPAPDFVSVEARPYDAGDLKVALGRVSAALAALQAGGLCGAWEISVPADDDGEVVTIAVDDDATIGAQFLLREQRAAVAGSAVLAAVRAALADAGVAYRADTFFLDPSTTRQGRYEPTQLLVSLSNLRAI